MGMCTVDSAILAEFMNLAEANDSIERENN